MAPYFQLAQCRNGLFLANPSDEYVGKSLLLLGEFSRQEALFLSRLVKPGWTVLEGGANIGALTVGLAQAVGPEGVVVAIEPQRLLFQALCGNLALNGIQNCVALHAALGKERGVTSIAQLDPSIPNNFGGLGLDVESQSRENVVMSVLDQFLELKPQLVKLDVEGWELEALRGGERLLDQRPVLYVEDDRERQRKALHGLLLSKGYDLYLHRPPLWDSENFRSAPSPWNQHFVSSNLLCIPSERKEEFQDAIEEVESTKG